ncbi:AtpZ/AtpI family protein [Acetobacter farinalis]|uniref:AtpZ/AtpI family protein n=1 Tax=Acetobacter farinalis TaxID=1260984 RepID=A0ABT3Q8E0_9PROT|nr:AtpZ/AtpI family protein [Acetobacter farinalis]MCX2561559.1 AtpZ/AtpI family protein [Acetobacter farinalis]NHO30059.1 F0F1 ATP synthase assembly protein I [Acetobacter farinalis]
MGEDSDESFTKRLREAERRAGQLEEGQKVSVVDKEEQSLPALALRAGTEMISALVVGVAAGWGLDRWFHTRAIFLIIFALLGGSAGVLNVWRLVKPPEQ